MVAHPSQDHGSTCAYWLFHTSPAEIDPYKFLLFDADGTLCQAESLSIDAFYGCISDITGREITNENTEVALHGQMHLSLTRDILKCHKIPRAEIQSTVDKFLELHPSYLKLSHENGFGSGACPHVDDVLSWLVEQNIHLIRIGLLAGNSRAGALFKIQAAGPPPQMCST